MIEIGTKAPEFCLPNQDEVEICSRDLKGKWVVLYFYPKDNTPGCTNEACDFTAAMPEFEDLDAVILGVSPDSPAKHRNFIEKKGLGLTLLSDEEKKVCKSYNVWQQKQMAGRKYMGVVRSTFIIDPEGDLAASWENVKVRKKRTVKGEKIETLHTDEVKTKLEELRK